MITSELIINRQISCLLGHNGAGKTSTLSVLTGLGVNGVSSHLLL